MRFMRVLFLLFFWWASLTMSAKNNIYGNKTEQRAIKMAYTLLQVYYHSNDLCVSDSIEDLEWFLFSDMVDNQTKQILDSYRKEKDFIWNDPVYCKKIATMTDN